MKNICKFSAAIFVLIILTYLVLALGQYTWRSIKLIGVETPEDFGICFRLDFPGAGDRYHQYTPVRCDDKNTKVSKTTLGANWGEMRFEDIDSDGKAEIILESDPAWWNIACADETLEVIAF